MLSNARIYERFNEFINSNEKTRKSISYQQLIFRLVSYKIPLLDCRGHDGYESTTITPIYLVK